MSTTAPATSGERASGPFDEPGRAESAGYRATGAAMSDQGEPPPRRAFGGDVEPTEYRDESDPSWRPAGAGDIASGSSAMQGTSTGTAYDSETGSGYTAMGMTGSSGGSMQGGGNTSYGNAGAGSSTASTDRGYANDPARRGLTGSAYEEPAESRGGLDAGDTTNTSLTSPEEDLARMRRGREGADYPHREPEDVSSRPGDVGGGEPPPSRRS